MFPWWWFYWLIWCPWCQFNAKISVWETCRCQRSGCYQSPGLLWNNDECWPGWEKTHEAAKQDLGTTAAIVCITKKQTGGGLGVLGNWRLNDQKSKLKYNINICPFSILFCDGKALFGPRFACSAGKTLAFSWVAPAAFFRSLAKCQRTKRCAERKAVDGFIDSGNFILTSTEVLP